MNDETNGLDLPEIKIGSFVKIRLTSKDATQVERVWCEVLSVNKDTQTLDLRIDNNPIVTPFRFGEKITIPIRFVLDVNEGYDV